MAIIRGDFLGFSGSTSATGGDRGLLVGLELGFERPELGFTGRPTAAFDPVGGVTLISAA